MSDSKLLLIELKFRRKGESIKWEDRPVESSVYIYATNEKEALACVMEIAYDRFDIDYPYDVIEEVRWNYSNSLQGHYVSHDMWLAHKEEQEKIKK